MDHILIVVNSWITSGSAIAALGCFIWGMASVILSPCHMASIPIIVSYVAGQEETVRTRHAAYYALSFTLRPFHHHCRRGRDLRRPGPDAG